MPHVAGERNVDAAHLSPLNHPERQEPFAEFQTKYDSQIRVKIGLGGVLEPWNKFLAAARSARP